MKTNRIVHKLQAKINLGSNDSIQHFLVGGAPTFTPIGMSHNGRPHLPFRSSKKKKNQPHAILPNLHGNPSSVKWKTTFQIRQIHYNKINIIILKFMLNLEFTIKWVKYNNTSPLINTISQLNISTLCL